MKIIMAVTAVAAALAAPVAAQAAPRALALGASANGALETSDPSTSDGFKYDEYAVQVAEGQAIEVTMRSEALDSFLEIGRGAGGDFESLASDDDGGGGSNARLRYRAAEGGAYTIRARSFAADARGAYQIEAKERVIVPPPAPTAASVGQTLKGTLAAGGARTEDNDRLYTDYTFEGREGARLMIEMVSGAFDALVELGKVTDGAFESLASDDDSGEDTNARLMTKLPSTGTFVVRAQALSSEGAGDYELRLSEVPAPGREGRPTMLRKGRIVSGELSLADPAFDEFQIYDLYEIRGQAGESVTINMRSDAFDSYLEAGARTSLGFATAQSDDDGGGDLNAKLVITFTNNGSVLVRARSLSPGATGAYSISAE